jgi:hypothetical protein
LGEARIMICVVLPRFHTGSLHRVDLLAYASRD